MGDVAGVRDVADLARTDAERVCLDALRGLAGGAGHPVELHSARVFEIAERMGAGLRELSRPDREVLLCAALLHDAGLFGALESGTPYVTDGRNLAAEVLAPYDWPRGRLRRCLDAVELHHHWRPVWSAGTEAELIRSADLVDLSAGAVRLGAARSTVSRAWLRELGARWPRRGFYTGLARLLVPLAARRPRALARIFVLR